MRVSERLELKEKLYNSDPYEITMANLQNEVKDTAPTPINNDERTR